jgi:uncharacterized membrane protein (UPF0127 family)
MCAMPRLAPIVVALVALVLTACGGDAKTTATDAQSEFERGSVTIETAEGKVVVPVEIAQTEQERELGLMNRTSLPEDDGMFFVFGGPQANVGFWMKNTLIPLSVAFADENGRIARILDMEPCEADPCTVYDPGATFVTALEANQGAFDRWGVAVGDQMKLDER